MRKIACITLDVEGDFHDPHGRIRLFEQDALFDRYVRLIRAFYAFTGQNPGGYRAPVGHITQEGLQTLLDLGLRSHSSIDPSFRPGGLGYNNLPLPVEPFRIRHQTQSILEIPFASLHGVRLVFSLSYVKLFGWTACKALMWALPPPRQMAVLAHPYDFYFHWLADQVTAGEKPLLSRNTRNAFDLFEKMIIFLQGAGYDFEFMSGLSNYVETRDLPEYDLCKVIR